MLDKDELIIIHRGLLKIFNLVGKLDRVNYTDYYWFATKVKKRIKEIENEIGEELDEKVGNIRKATMVDIKYD